MADDLAKLLSDAYGPSSLSTANVLDHLPPSNPLDDARGYLAQYMRRPGNPNPPTQEQWNALAYEPPRSEPSGMQKTLANVLSNPDLQPAFMAANFIGPGPKFMPPRIPNPIKAYHGSPHDFGEFSLSKVGTGEGAQAYGHGLYFAEHEPVARGYRDKLTNQTNFIRSDGSTWDPSTLEHLNVRVAARDGAATDLDKVIARAQDLRADPGMSRQMREMLDRDLGRLSHLKESGGVSTNPGKMYEVALHATPEQFLDWDRPLSAQSEAVRKALANPIAEAQRKNASFRAANGWGDEPMGSHFKGQEDLLAGAGIPGFRYLDQGSRGKAFRVDLETKGGPYRVDDPATFESMQQAKRYAADKAVEGFKTNIIDQGSRNYAVWTPEIIEILRKYGIAAPVAGGALANALGAPDQK